MTRREVQGEIEQGLSHRVSHPDNQGPGGRVSGVMLVPGVACHLAGPHPALPRPVPRPWPPRARDTRCRPGCEQS